MTLAKRKNIVFSTLTTYNRVFPLFPTLANHPTRFLSEKTLDPESGYLSETEHKHKHCNRKTSEGGGYEENSSENGLVARISDSAAHGCILRAKRINRTIFSGGFESK